MENLDTYGTIHYSYFTYTVYILHCGVVSISSMCVVYANDATLVFLL